MRVSINDLQSIFRDVFENNLLEIHSEMTAADVQGWDSLNHIYLVVAIEKAFNVKFTTQEIQSWQCVGDIISGLNKKKDNAL